MESKVRQYGSCTDSLTVLILLDRNLISICYYNFYFLRVTQTSISICWSPSLQAIYIKHSTLIDSQIKTLLRMETSGRYIYSKVKMLHYLRTLAVTPGGITNAVVSLGYFIMQECICKCNSCDFCLSYFLRNSWCFGYDLRNNKGF